MPLLQTEYRFLESLEELGAFIPEWERLWASDPHSSPFQSPAWLVPWWRQFGNDRLCAIVIEREGKAVGFLPFYVYLDTDARKSRVLPLGVGTTDYLDGMFAPECSRREIAGAIEAICKNVDHDEFCATQLPENSRLLEAIRQGSESTASRWGGQAARISQSDGCSRMPAVTMAQLPQKIRRNAMYYRNRALRCGSLELAQADESNWGGMFDELRRLHRLRWQARGEDGVLVDERVVRWHQEAIPLLLRAGLLRLMALKLNEECIAVLYSLIDREKSEKVQYFYITAYSTEHSDLRPGTLLIAHAVERAAQERVVTIDMLRGDESYKQFWHMEKVPTWCVTQMRPVEIGSGETAA